MNKKIILPINYVLFLLFLDTSPLVLQYPWLLSFLSWEDRKFSSFLFSRSAFPFTGMSFKKTKERFKLISFSPGGFIAVFDRFYEFSELDHVLIFSSTGWTGQSEFFKPWWVLEVVSLSRSFVLYFFSGWNHHFEKNDVVPRCLEWYHI